MAEIQDSELINYLDNCRKEASEAKRDRMDKNRINFDAYHLRQDWSHKLKGQSREFLPKVATAVEQNSNMIQQGLLDLGKWFNVTPQAGLNEDMMSIKPSVIYNLLERQLSKDGFVKKTGDMLKLGMLGGLIIVKIGGKYVNKPKFVVETEVRKGKYFKKLIKKDMKSWQLDIQLIRQEDYYPDPTGRGLYEACDFWLDLHEVKRLAEGDDAIYDKEAVDQLTGGFDSTGMTQEWAKSRETDQNVAGGGYRKQVKITEVWGNVLNSEGELIYENVVYTVANDRFVIQKPTPNPYWHQESPFVTDSILSVPHAVWPKAMMDAATSLNLSANEIFNLLLDSGIVSVHGIKQLRKDWLDDPSQVSNGVEQGSTLLVNSSCPPGQKVLESVYTGGQPQEAMNMLNVVNQESAAAMFTSEIRAGGADMKNIRATAVVENSQALNNMASGMIKNIEGDDNSGLITQILIKSWKTIAQNMDDLDSAEVKALIGEKEAQRLMAMGREQVFADTVQSSRFRVFGISAVLNKMKDFTKLTAMMQTIFSNPMLTEAFLKKYSIPKFLDEIMLSLDINTFKLEADSNEGGELTEEAAPVQAGADVNSQIPQAGSAINQGDMNAMASSQPASPQAL
jgi:hypothetical protein